MPEMRLTNAELVEYLDRAVVGAQRAEFFYHRGLWAESAESRRVSDLYFQQVRAELVARGL